MRIADVDEGARFSEVDETLIGWTLHCPEGQKKHPRASALALDVLPAHVAQTVCHVTLHASHVLRVFRENYDPCPNP